MGETAARTLRFDRFTLDLDRSCLRADGQELELRPKAFEILRCLVENAGRLVSKRTLMERAWPNVFVSDDSLVQCIRELREKLGDDDHRLIKTVSRRGYLLEAAEPAAVRLDAATIAEPPVPSAPARRFARPSVIAAAVLLLAVLAGSGFLAWRAVGHGAVVAIGGGHAEAARQVFKDCEKCPEMVALPAGTFMMGSPADEPDHVQVEGTPRRVTIGQPFAIGRFEVTVDQYALFLEATGTPASTRCRFIPPRDPAAHDGLAEHSPVPEVHQRKHAVGWGPAQASFRQQPGYDITGSHPAGCISRIEAEAFVAWLRVWTGKPYRLPTESEWEYAARAGTTTRYSFGNDERLLCGYARFSDLSSEFGWRGACRSDKSTRGSLPVGSLKPNGWGLFDMHGNVWEWVADCWTPDPAQIPLDGSAVTEPGQCEVGVIRGGSWAASYPRVRSAFRLGTAAVRRDQNIGFRVALPL